MDAHAERKMFALLDVIASGVKRVEERVTTLDSRVTTLDTRVTTLDTRVTTLVTRVTTLEATTRAGFDRLERRLARHESRIEALEESHPQG